MPAEVVKTELLLSQGIEKITIMDDYGNPFYLCVIIANTPDRQAQIDAAIDQQTKRQTAHESYAAQHSYDISAEKTAGLAKKQDIKQAAKAKG